MLNPVTHVYIQPVAKLLLLCPFLFSMYLNDLEDEFYLKGAKGVNVNMLKLFILLYADDIILFANSPEEMQNSLL